MLLFDGNDMQNWLFEIEEYFSYHKVLEAQRLGLVVFHLEGKATLWFQLLRSNKKLDSISWADFLHKT